MKRVNGRLRWTKDDDSANVVIQASGLAEGNGYLHI